MMLMRKKKKRCLGCMSVYSSEAAECPRCGCGDDTNYTQSIPDALPLCTIVGNLRIGKAISMDDTGISYVGLDTEKNKRVHVREFFVPGRMTRLPEGNLKAAAERDIPVIEQKKKEFCQTKGREVNENGTVYLCRSLKKKDLRERKRKKELTQDIALRSIIGTRANQQDSAAFRLFEDGLFAVVCDGMGGISAGEVASTECVRKMLGSAETAYYSEEEILPDFMRRTVVGVDAYVSSLQDMDRQRLHCGTTLLCVSVKGDHMFFTSVGDSHIYLIRDRRITLLTEEHNYLADLMEQVEKGEMDYEDAVSHPKREALTSYVGIGNISLIHISDTFLQLKDGDAVLMCSDGVYRALSDEEICARVTENSKSDAAADGLICSVKEKNLPKQDNATLILYKYSGKGK